MGEERLSGLATLYIQSKIDMDNLLTVEPRAEDPHCFDADPEPDPNPAQNLDADPDPAQNLDADADADPYPDPGGGGGVGQPKMCIPPGKILGTPLSACDEIVSLSAQHAFRCPCKNCLNFLAC